MGSRHALQDPITNLGPWRRHHCIRNPIGDDTAIYVDVPHPHRHEQDQSVSQTQRQSRQLPGGASERLDKRSIKSPLEIVGSRLLAAKIAKHLKLATLPEFNSSLAATNLQSRTLRMLGIGGPRPGQSEHDRVLEAYFQRLKVFHSKDKRAITIAFSSADPKLAAALANTLSEVYLQVQKTEAEKQTKEARDQLASKVQKLRKEVAAAEQAAAAFRATAGRIKGSRGNATLNARQLSDLSTRLSRARERKSEADTHVKLGREMLRSGRADSAPDVLKSPMIQGLQQQRASLQRQISELSATLLPAHPHMRQLSDDLSRLNRQIRRAVGKVLTILEKEALVAGLHLESIQAGLNALKQRAATSGGAQIELADLEREAKSKREVLETYLQRFSDANAGRPLKSVHGDAEVYDRAVPSSHPSFPKTLPMTLVSMTVALLLGLGVVITRALLTGPRTQSARPPAIDADAPSNAAGDISPQIPTPAQEIAQPSGGPAAITIERIAKLASLSSVSRHLLARGQDRSGFRTMAVGTSLRAECSAEVLKIAEQLAQAGKQVLIVDWAPEGQELFQTCGLNLTKGLADLATGAAVFEDVIHCLPGKEMHVICAGTGADQAEALNDTDRLNLIFDALDETYDHILAYGPFDSARNLFTAMQGRFDAGLLITDETDNGVGAEPMAGFLGYDIPDLEIILYEPANDGRQLTPHSADDKRMAAS